MGRPERDLSPEEGPVQAFAVALRRLREEAGSPPYRALAERAHYSPTVLSRAAGGRALPSLEVTLAFVRACGGDEDAWARRWQQVSEELSASARASAEPAVDADPSPAPGAAGAVSSGASGGAEGRPAADVVRGSAGRSTGRRSLPAPVAALAVLVALGAAGATALGLAGHDGLAPGWRARNQHVTERVVDASRAEDMDGDDPRARGCGADLETIETLDAVPLDLPDGTRFGTLRLRRSPGCDTAWASAYFDNPRLYTVWLAAHRPADKAQVRSQWSNNTPPGSYGDMLSLAPGCVWVEGWVVTGQGEGPHARTRCLR
ncbi:helix-turn-helix domain-containing protein [Microbispora sp. CA-135349]|uniref:helix-turn-helix domain-containing protein n=1 Tax=Microbispora sp. CA-135349 TaxID=3239953 RepID=UPI003D927743